MGVSVNTVTLVGYVGQVPAESRNQRDSVSFSLATSEKWRGEDGVMHEHTDWHRIRCRGRIADIARRSVDKGDRLGVTGRLAVYDVPGDDGRKRRIVEVVASRLILLEPPPPRHG